jgi:hypothetical protein
MTAAAVYYVLIIFLQDPARAWHTLRTSVYSTQPACEAAGQDLVAKMGKDSKGNYYCVQADLPN